MWHNVHPGSFSRCGSDATGCVQLPIQPAEERARRDLAAVCVVDARAPERLLGVERARRVAGRLRVLPDRFDTYCTAKTVPPMGNRTGHSNSPAAPAAPTAATVRAAAGTD
jgi:hypothetical protein